MGSTNYGYILLFFVGALAFGVITLWASRIFAPSRSYEKKNSTYECGEIPVGIAWVQFNVGYYIFALIFVIFDVETVFLYPWAAIFRKLVAAGLGRFAMLEMTVFIGILVLGLAYAWRKGVLKWA